MVLESSEQQKRGFRDLMKSNKKSLISLCVILVFIGFAFLWLDYSEKNKRIKISENFIEAKIFLTKNNRSKSLEILNYIIMEKDNTLLASYWLILRIGHFITYSFGIMFLYIRSVIWIGSIVCLILMSITLVN